MNFIEKIVSFFTGRISDEEFDRLVEENDAVCCPRCNTFISKQDLIDDGWRCPVCRAKIEKSS